MSSLFLRTLCLVLTATRLTVAGQSSVNELCPFWKDAIYASGKCYKGINKELDFDGALKYCQEQELATLAEIHTDDQQMALKSLMLSMSNVSRLWLGARTPNRVFSWLSNSQVIDMGSKLWVDGEPNNNGCREDCVALWEGKLNDVPCYLTTYFAFACQKGQSSVNELCPFWKDAIYASGKCYKGINKELNFDDALKYCQEQELATLAEIHTDDQQMALQSILNLMPNASQLRLGARTPNRVFSWLSNNQVINKGSSLWNDGEPNNRECREDCVALLVEGKLNDRVCSFTSAFACQKVGKATHNEELNPIVIGLSVALFLSILGIAVLAYLYFRLHRQMQNGNNSLHLKSKQTERSSLKVGFKNNKTMSPVGTVSTPQSSSKNVITIKKNEGVGKYGNVPATAPNYDQISRDIDEHFYDEMT